MPSGDQEGDGAKDPQQVLLTRGREDVQRYIIDEVQKVYRSQGVSTNGKHIEVICRQMLRKVSIIYPGDTDFLQDERIDRFEFNQINEEILAEGGEPATAMPVGVNCSPCIFMTTKASCLPSGEIVGAEMTSSEPGAMSRLRRRNVLVS